MKKFLSILLICYAGNIYANNYGNQDSVFLTVRGTYGGTTNLIGLVHVPSDYNTDMLTKHPFIIFISGRGSYGTTKMNVQNEGMSNALYTGSWDGTAINPKSSITEEFITLSLQNPNSTNGVDGREVDDAIGWLFSHYHSIDTTRGTVTGLSRGGGSTCFNLQHILIANPPNWTYFHPVHNIPFYIPMSAENNSTDPVDSVFIYNNHVWAFGGDSTGCTDIHGVTTHQLVDHINAVKPNLAQFTSYYSAQAGCHSGWERFYASSYTSTYTSDFYSFPSISIYQAALLYVATNNAIVTGIVSGSPFCVTATAGASFSISYTATGYYPANNRFRAQLSTSTGSFTAAPYIGILTTTARSGTINCIIPAGTVTSTKYKMRINSTETTPATVGNSTSYFTINLAANSIAPTADQNITAGTSGNTLTVTEQSTPTARRWYYGTTSGGPYNTSTTVTGTTYTPNFSSAGTYYVICQSYYSSCATIISNQVKINVSAGLRNLINDQTAFSAQSKSGQVICSYKLTQSCSVRLTVYDEYQRPRATISKNQSAGSYVEEFSNYLPNGIYVVVLQVNQQKIGSQKIVIGN